MFLVSCTARFNSFVHRIPSPVRAAFGLESISLEWKTVFFFPVNFSVPGAFFCTKF